MKNRSVSIRNLIYIYISIRFICWAEKTERFYPGSLAKSLKPDLPIGIIPLRNARFTCGGKNKRGQFSLKKKKKKITKNKKTSELAFVKPANCRLETISLRAVFTERVPIFQVRPNKRTFSRPHQNQSQFCAISSFL